MTLLTRYADVERYAEVWLKGRFPLLIIWGSGGTGKTSHLRRVLKDAYRMTSHATPRALFKELYEHRNEVLWFDDVDNLLKQSINVSLLKQVCDTSEPKTVSYHTTFKGDDTDNELPQQFETTSRVVITLNDYRALSKNLGALDDRGLVLNFEPTRKELMDKMRSFAEDKEVYTYIRRHSQTSDKLSLRTYFKGILLKEVEPDGWKKLLLGEMRVNEKYRLMVELLEEWPEKRYRDTIRMLYWNWSKRDYYTWKKKVLKKKVCKNAGVF